VLDVVGLVALSDDQYFDVNVAVFVFVHDMMDVDGDRDGVVLAVFRCPSPLICRCW